jgi:hypothetical protein
MKTGERCVRKRGRKVLDMEKRESLSNGEQSINVTLSNKILSKETVPVFPSWALQNLPKIRPLLSPGTFLGYNAGGHGKLVLLVPITSDLSQTSCFKLFYPPTYLTSHTHFPDPSISSKTKSLPGPASTQIHPTKTILPGCPPLGLALCQLGSLPSSELLPPGSLLSRKVQQLSTS